MFSTGSTNRGGGCLQFSMLPTNIGRGSLQFKCCGGVVCQPKHKCAHFCLFGGNLGAKKAKFSSPSRANGGGGGLFNACLASTGRGGGSLMLGQPPQTPGALEMCLADFGPTPVLGGGCYKVTFVLLSNGVTVTE